MSANLSTREEQFSRKVSVHLHAIVLGLSISVARQLMAVKLPNAALRILNSVAIKHSGDRVVLDLRIDALKQIGRTDEAIALQGSIIRDELRITTSQRNITKMLILMARLESLKQAGLLGAGYIISDRLMSERGQRSLLNSVRKARKKIPDSPFLVHIQTICQARLGEYKAAHKLLQEQIAKNPSVTNPEDKRSFEIRSDSWRVVDLAARENMDWAGDEQGYETLISNSSSINTRAGGQIGEESAERVFKEHALQGRMREDYLDMCEHEFQVARTPGQKLRAINEMVRTGSRHIPNYSNSYERARKCLQEMKDVLETVYRDEGLSSQDKDQTVAVLCAWLRLSRRLQSGSTERILQRLVRLSEDEDWAPALIRAPETIANDPDRVDTASMIMSRLEHVKLTKNWQISSYFRWAMLVSEYEKAHKKFAQLPREQKRHHGSLYFSNILQREGNFIDATQLVRNVHAELLRVPHLVKPFSNHSLIKRRGELDFLRRTATIYGSVKQPKNPAGIVLIAPRNIDQLRRYPLLVLRELKRKGWAVVPLVEGLLPRERTGKDEIDVLNGAISFNAKLSAQAEDHLPDLEQFDFRPADGHMSWNSIDLSHAVWEDSAINRRIYSVDFSCPELQVYLGSLAKWTSAMLRVLEKVRELHEIKGQRIAAISLFGHRLPDAVFRSYCERFGNADTFYYVHAANGYQNYFTNFSTNISERLVLRNLTRYRNVRSASFPVPEAFEAYYAEHRVNAEQLLSRWEGVTRVKRSTVGRKSLPEDASLLLERIQAWRSDGGKVACAFGKVVFDSSVPFDGGPAHRSMRDWINHCVESVQGSNTLLLIKPHPHEINNNISTFPNEYFRDLIKAPPNDNVEILGHNWFDIHDMKELIDLGLIYNGTTAVELGILGIPCLLSGHFSEIDYPIGHVTPKSRAEFESLLRFEQTITTAADIRQRAAVWLDYMANNDFTQPYRFHTRPVTNKVLYPPTWFDEDLATLERNDNTSVHTLVSRFLGEVGEPGMRLAKHNTVSQ